MTDLVGPVPEVNTPKFPTPWVAEGRIVQDKNGQTITEVYAVATSWQQDKDLAKIIVDAVNEKYGSPIVPGSGSIEYWKDSQGDHWFQMQPGLWTLGGHTSPEVSYPSAARRYAERDSMYRNRALEWLTVEFGPLSDHGYYSVP